MLFKLLQGKARRQDLQVDCCSPCARVSPRAVRAWVVSGKPAATAAGIEILEQGGNAADAGAATLLALSVTYVGAFCMR